MPGTLFVVATPIGNLEDLTFRALRTLKAVDLIAAEDTRRTSKLLAHYEIQKPLVSLHAHNESREAPKLIERLRGGASIALVSDAGTPGISDPGQTLVALAREAGLPVSPIPGPSAVTAALSISGFQGDGFVFLGFPPSTGSARAEWFRALGDETRVAVFFEAPHRIGKTLEQIGSSVERPILVCRELTKTHESFVFRPINAELSGGVREQGEFVVVVGAADDQIEDGIGKETLAEASTIIGLITEHSSMSESQAIEAVSAGLRLQPNRLRRALKKEQIRTKRAADGSS